MFVYKLDMDLLKTVLPLALAHQILILVVPKKTFDVGTGSTVTVTAGKAANLKWLYRPH